jgi:hypothetical protein
VDTRTDTEVVEHQRGCTRRLGWRIILVGASPLCPAKGIRYCCPWGLGTGLSGVRGAARSLKRAKKDFSNPKKLMSNMAGKDLIRWPEQVPPPLHAPACVLQDLRKDHAFRISLFYVARTQHCDGVTHGALAALYHGARRPEGRPALLQGPARCDGAGDEAARGGDAGAPRPARAVGGLERAEGGAARQEGAARAIPTP